MDAAAASVSANGNPDASADNYALRTKEESIILVVIIGTAVCVFLIGVILVMIGYYFCYYRPKSLQLNQSTPALQAKVHSRSITRNTPQPAAISVAVHDPNQFDKSQPRAGSVGEQSPQLPHNISQSHSGGIHIHFSDKDASADDSCSQRSDPRSAPIRSPARIVMARSPLFIFEPQTSSELNLNPLQSRSIATSPANAANTHSSFSPSARRHLQPGQLCYADDTETKLAATTVPITPTSVSEDVDDSPFVGLAAAVADALVQQTCQ